MKRIGLSIVRGYLILAVVGMFVIGCATAPIDQAKQAGLAMKVSIESSYGIVKGAHRDRIVSDEDFLEAYNSYKEYEFWQTQYADVMSAWEDGVEPNGSTEAMQHIAPIFDTLADMVAKYGLEGGGE